VRADCRRTMRKKNIITVSGLPIRIQGDWLRVARPDGDKYTCPDNPEVLIAEMRKARIPADLFTFLQSVSDRSPRYSYAMEYDNLAVLPVSTFEHWWNHQIRSYPRNRARQAEKKGVTFREVPFGEELIQGICGIYNETPMRQGKAFPYYGMTLEQAHDYAGTYLDLSAFIGAFVGNTMIGFVKLTMDVRRTQACMVHILSMVKHNDKAPTNALISQSVRYCAEHKVPHLVYEHFQYGNKAGDSLSHFKEVNGFQRVDLPRYYIPLTGKGKIALQLGLHRRLMDRIPESVAGKLRDLRKTWYRRRFQAQTES
jgi:hypothetical protein